MQLISISNRIHTSNRGCCAGGCVGTAVVLVVPAKRCWQNSGSGGAGGGKVAVMTKNPCPRRLFLPVRTKGNPAERVWD